MPLIATSLKILWPTRLCDWGNSPMRVRAIIRDSSLLVLASLLFGCVLRPQDERWGSYDRLLVTQSFLNSVYPELKGVNGLLILRTEGIHFGMGWMNEIDVISCDTGSGVYGGNVPSSPAPPPYCSGLYPSGPSDFLSLEILFSKMYPIRDFSAGGSFVRSRAMGISDEIAKHPEWSQEQRIDALKHANPKFGPENKQELLRIIPLDAIRNFTGCSLQLTTAALSAWRYETPPDSPTAGVAWRISGRYLNAPRNHNFCSAAFEPFDGRLLSITDH